MQMLPILQLSLDGQSAWEQGQLFIQDLSASYDMAYCNSDRPAVESGLHQQTFFIHKTWFLGLFTDVDIIIYDA